MYIVQLPAGRSTYPNTLNIALQYFLAVLHRSQLSDPGMLDEALLIVISIKFNSTKIADQLHTRSVADV